MINATDLYSIHSITGNEVLSKDGSISLVYLVTNPEPYSLDEEKLNLRHSALIKGFRNLNNDTYIQYQTIVIEDVYDAQEHFDKFSFLSRADFEHFDKRETIRDYNLLIFTLSGLPSMDKKHIANPFVWKSDLVEKDKQELNSFYEAVKISLSVIKNLYNTSVTVLQENEIKFLFKEYVNGFNQDNGMRDISFNNNIEIGDTTYSAFSISNAEYLPDSISSVDIDNTVNIEGLTLYRGFMDDFGVYFPHNHIYNQIIHIVGHTKLKDELEKTIELYNKNKSFGAGIENDYKRIKGILESILENNYTLCKAHFSILLWNKDKKKLKEAEDKVKGILGNKDIKYYLPSYEGLFHLFVGTVPCRASKLHKDFKFLTTLENALCFFNNYSFYRSDERGIVFQSRLLQVPIRRDLWDDKKERIRARNMAIFSPTGGGKSALAQHINNQVFNQGRFIVVADFGNSFEHLTLLYPEESVHIKVEPDSPLGINPFDLGGNPLTTDKIYSLSHVILKFWRIKLQDYEKEAVSVAVRKFIADYYANVDSKHSFPSFYYYLIDHYREILNRTEVPENYFDIENFKLVCSEFLEGGIYENVCKGGKDNEDKLRGKRLIVFELKGIKGNSFLSSVVLSILKDTFNEKILSDRSVKGELWFDEFAQAQEMKNEYDGDDVLSIVALAFQTIRKENGRVVVIYQSPSQMPVNNHYIENMIDNTQIIGVLEATEKVYGEIVKRFKITNESHIKLMRSLRNNFNVKRAYSEICLIFNQDYATVVRLELPTKKLLAFQTEGEKWSYLQQDYKQTGSLEQSIENLIEKEDEENNFGTNLIN